MDPDPGDVVEGLLALNETFHLTERLTRRISWRFSRNKTTVPDVRQLSVAQARQALANSGLRIAPSSGPVPDDSIVAGQAPDPGQVVRLGRAVTLGLIDPPEARLR
jgi:beta-lactam-binding protein with PASTA domain